MRTYVLIVLCALMGLAAEGYSGIEPAVDALLKRLGRYPPRTETLDSGRIVVEGNDYVLTFDTKLGELLLWLDDAKAPKRSSPATEEVAWEQAEAWFAKAQVSVGDRISAKLRQSAGKPSEFTVKFGDKPFGYPVSVGNQAIVEVDAHSGQVTSVTRVVGYRYDDPPKNPISQEEALEVFADAIKRRYDVEPTSVKVTSLAYGIGDPPGRGELGASNRPDLLKSKRARLLYHLSATLEREGGDMNFTGTVDPDMAMVMGGGLVKSTGPLDVSKESSAARSRRSAMRASPSPALAAVAAGIAGILLGSGATFLAMRRQK